MFQLLQALARVELVEKCEVALLPKNVKKNTSLLSLPSMYEPYLVTETPLEFITWPFIVIVCSKLAFIIHAQC